MTRLTRLRWTLTSTLVRALPNWGKVMLIHFKQRRRSSTFRSTKHGFHVAGYQSLHMGDPMVPAYADH